VSVIGASTDWADLIDPLVPDILRLIVATWDGMTAPANDDGEDKITMALCRALQQNRTARGLMFQIRTQVVELEPAAGEPLGRMDIAFIPLVPREEIYFCLESKRLNVVKDENVRTYTSEYVSFGMLRFIRGQYSRAVRHGGMIGYVLDGDIPRAISNVESNMQSQCTDLGMATPATFFASAILSGEMRAKETRHMRPINAEPFLLHHLFMPASVVPLPLETT
jgi:hypothetical protein